MRSLKKITLLLVILFGSISNSAETKAPPAPSSEEIRCEKFISTSLTDFKEKLVQNCNLNKPFSSSVSRVLNDETYFYCCHKR